MKAKTIQVCGTGSGVGKSVIVAGLCRMFLQDGFKVAPFKAQNMALNSAVTQENLEIGRAQAMQAEACGIEPTVDMNPILLKPTSDVGCQVIVRGKPLKNMNVLEYHDYKLKALKIVKESINRLRSQYDIVVIEGAGSPAEINLKSHDIVNMKIASLVKAAVILVGDIDRGGVFAWLIGTLELLSESEKRLIKGFIINKFRGDKTLLDSGLSFLEKKTDKKVLGVIPYFKDIKLPEEDSLFFDQNVVAELARPGKSKASFATTRAPKIKIVIVKLPHISNFTDFDVFEREQGVVLEYSTDLKSITKADCIILPGSKNTCRDLQFLYDKGIADSIKMKGAEGVTIVGICAGYQMLGCRIIDPLGVENKDDIEGLGLLSVDTRFEKRKNTFQVEARDFKTGVFVKGYEIHHGHSRRRDSCQPLFLIKKRGTQTTHVEDGAVNSKGNIWGTYIHGLFDNFYFRKNFINRLCFEKGLNKQCNEDNFSQDREFDKLAKLLRDNINMGFLAKILNL